MGRFLKSLSVLQWALGISFVVHAVLLTVRFVDPEGFKRVFEESPLEVILVNAKSDTKPEKAQALAQASLAGGGESAEKRIASTPLPPSVVEVQGDSAIDQNQRNIDSMLQQQEQLMAQIRDQMAALPPPEQEQKKASPEAQAQEEKRRQLAKMLAAIERRVEEENSRPKKRYLSPATLGTTYALYYDELRRKIEARGTRNFPEVAGRKLYGELMMALLVNHDGRILDARVVRGSGNRVLDRLAEAIAQAAAPFGSFSTAMRKETDQIDITARFVFTHEMTLETALLDEAPTGK
ncbi:energy transducer TonB [Ottowia thiooxydans]|uniref:energy transducer TonB n=1 Tax=Ottowia thiooxydans TaxID=219182 RepID=UPI0012EC34E7|nr:TonB family protein [Ottowia thiooxydans]